MNLALLTPELSLAGTAILVVLLDLVIPRKGWLAAVSIAGILVSAGFTLGLWGATPQATCYGMLAVDNFALFFKLLFLAIAILVILASSDYVSRFARFQGEYYALVLISALGMMLMAATAELISIYLALELTGISLYVLTGFLKDKKSTEASLKYLLLGAVASAVLLFGMALIFGFTGATHLSDIFSAIAMLSTTSTLANPGLILGMVLIIAGFGFKIAAIPFHMWVPDVYEGAPTPVTAYLSVASKAAGFAVILRVFLSGFGIDWLSFNWGIIFAVLAVIGMFVGNITAFPQTNIKRLLGYSSIAQAGYLMVGLAALGVTAGTNTAAQSAILFFIAGYALTNLGAFIAIIAIANATDSDEISDYAGMIKRAPILTIGFSLCLISLIGLPPAVGFMAKFYIFSEAVKSGLLWLVIIAVLNSVISAYYYLRVVKVMWLGKPATEEKVAASPALRLALVIACLGVLVLFVIPGSVMKLTELASRMLGT